MSLKVLAQHIADQGRGPDTMLVHMAPAEVGSLQALAQAHGGSLTIHPDTGLPEAGFLSSILPMVAGGLLSLTGVGAPLAAALVGGATGLAKGSVSKGLMAGLGAFGGAGLTSGLTSVGAGTNAALNAAPTGSTFAQNAANAQMGLSQMAQAPLDTAKMAMAAMPKYTLPAAGMGLASALTPKQQALQGNKKNADMFYQTTYNPGTPNPNFGQPGEPYFLNQGYGPGQYTRTYPTGLADGGYISGSARPKQRLASAADESDKYYGMESSGRVTAREGNTKRSYKDMDAAQERRNYERDSKRYGYHYADGGTIHGSPTMDQFYQSLLGNQQNPMDGYAASLVQGGGDGVSDSVPAHIDGQQPAALSRGEFVIPAKIVAELGNGSSEAGADKLRAMMQRVMQHRQASADAGMDTGAAEELPA